jgi:hypothetical protein
MLMRIAKELVLRRKEARKDAKKEEAERTSVSTVAKKRRDQAASRDLLPRAALWSAKSAPLTTDCQRYDWTSGGLAASPGR